LKKTRSGRKPLPKQRHEDNMLRDNDNNDSESAEEGHVAVEP
jgi:hypothetical protein